MRRVAFFAAFAVFWAVASATASAHAGGEDSPFGDRPGQPPEDEELPALPASNAEEAPHGAQDGVIAGAALGAARGISEASLWSPATTASSPTQRYAGLDKATCETELGKRKIKFERVGEARGVVAPVRLTGDIGGVNFHSMLPVAQRKTSPYEIYDCRLVLARSTTSRKS